MKIADGPEAGDRPVAPTPEAMAFIPKEAALNAERYFRFDSMFVVGRSMLDVRIFVLRSLLTYGHN
jgi:hypothetical protein